MEQPESEGILERQSNQSDDTIMRPSDELLAKVILHFKEHTSEVRKSIDIGTDFYSKLATLSAGSIAIIASAGTAVLLKPEIHAQVRGTIAPWIIVAIVASLWLSLCASLLHNLLVVRIYQNDARNSDYSLIDCVIKELLYSIEGDLQTKMQAEELIREVREPDADKVRRRSFSNERLRNLTVYIGHGAVATFVLPFTLLAYCILRLTLG